MQAIDTFFANIEPIRSAYEDVSLNYVAIRHSGGWILINGRLIFYSRGSQLETREFQSENVRAGRFKLSDVGLDARSLLERLLSGRLSSPHGELYFPTSQTGPHITTFIPFHPSGLQAQTRANALLISGDQKHNYINQPALDWELKGASTPYDNLNELLNDYHLNAASGDLISFEAFALQVCAVDFGSPVDGENAKIIIRLANGLDASKARLGYRVLSRGGVVARSSVSSEEMEWVEEDGYKRGSVDLRVPLASVIHSIVSYDGVAQHFGWLSDPRTLQNPRRAAYEAVDTGLEALREILDKTPSKGFGARELESAIGWVLWMLGFGVAHLGGNSRMQDAADLIITSPFGHFALVECTTGLLKADNKLPLLHSRAQAVRRRLQAADSPHLRVLPIIVTTKPRADVEPDMQQAARLGILVIAGDQFGELLNRTLVRPAADQLFEEAEQAVRNAQATHGFGVQGTA
jgi:hypothetical protein